LKTRITNRDVLLSTGNFKGRKAMLDILEAGLQASDPYTNTLKLIRREGERLIIGHQAFEPPGSPVSGDEVFNLADLGNIYVFGACKGVQRVAKAIEEILGDRLTGGHVIDKKGSPMILERVGVTLGSHPVPDEDCVRGCRRILDLTQKLKENDLVFAVSGNGISSLLTLPSPGITVEEVRETTYKLQIERGVPTFELNAVRNHLDELKGGQITRHFHPAKAIHIVAFWPYTYEQLMGQNIWLHTLPDYSTFQTAIDILHKWDAWEAVPASVRRHLLKADPRQETVKADEFKQTPSRIFEIMPQRAGSPESALQKAEELGFKAVVLAEKLFAVEAKQAGLLSAVIARTVEQWGQPVEPPCALFLNGEMVVTVNNETGMGGRNQEFALATAQRISGSPNIIIGSVDTDGTDGPGPQFSEGKIDIPCLAGGLADGTTLEEAIKRGINLVDALKRHDTSPALWGLNSGIVATPNISMNDLTVILVMGRSG
jgi:glycerate 2-kinase